MSAFCRDHLKGYVYIESRHLSYVARAIDGLLGFYGSKITLVPINDMALTLFVKPVERNVKEGAWVRVKRGKFKGDLAQVITLADDEMVRCKVLPRIDVTAMSSKEPLKRKKGYRPPQRLFRPDEWE